jgi:hypothetical protein
MGNQESQKNYPECPYVRYGLLHNKVIRPFSFTEAAANATTYLDMLEIYTFLQFEEGVEIIHHDVRDTFDERFPGWWIGQEGLIPWLPRSPDLAPRGFFLWGYFDGEVYRSTGLVDNVEEPKHWITTAVASATPDMLSHFSLKQSFSWISAMSLQEPMRKFINKNSLR